MLKRTILSSLLAFTALSPVVVYANTSSAEIKHELTDTATTTKIKALYVLSPLIKTLDIAVTTMNHDVTLMGTVDTDMQYEEAVSLAQSVEGVSDVNVDKLQVKASQAPLADTYLTAKAKGMLMKEKLFGSKSVEYWPITIETKDGEVYLAGTVDTDDQRVNIVKLIEGIKGVKSVKSVIAVK